MTVLTIFRYEKGQVANYQQYNVDKKLGTVLEALKEIQAHQDPTISFRHNCGSSQCGSCAMTINGKQQLACKTPLTEEPMTIEPLKSYPVIKDLIIDQKGFWQNYEATKPWLVKDKSKDYPYTNEDITPARDASLCVQCGACTSACSVYAKDKTFFGPAAATTLYRFIKDPRDARIKERCQLATTQGLWSCTKAFACQEVCPIGLNPTEMIRQIKEESILQKVKDPGAARATTYLDAIKTYGKPNEIKTTIASQKVSFALPTLLELARKKKLPPKEIVPNESAKDLQRLFRRQSK